MKLDWFTCAEVEMFWKRLEMFSLFFSIQLCSVKIAVTQRAYKMLKTVLNKLRTSMFLWKRRNISNTQTKQTTKTIHTHTKVLLVQKNSQSSVKNLLVSKKAFWMRGGIFILILWEFVCEVLELKIFSFRLLRDVSSSSRCERNF